MSERERDMTSFESHFGADSFLLPVVIGEWARSQIIWLSHTRMSDERTDEAQQHGLHSTTESVLEPERVSMIIFDLHLVIAIMRQ